MPLYFAYGSNMDGAAMAARCPASRVVGRARLARHRLAIMREGYATVLRDPRRTVHGLLWDLSLADLPALDRYENVAGGLYVKVQLPVLTETGPKRALVYLGQGAGPGLPQPGYLENLMAAAEAAGLPRAYLEEISGLGSRRAGLVAPQLPATAKVRPTRATPHDADPAIRRESPWDG